MVIEQISQMKQQGLQTNEIIQNLKQQGVSPKEINEALSQSEIKSAISNNQNIFPGGSTASMQQQTTPTMNTGMQQPNVNQSVQQSSSAAQMQPSISQQPAQPTMQNQMQPQSMHPVMSGGMGIQQPPQMGQPGLLEPSTQDYSQYQEYGSEEYYPEYQQSGGADIETINDISSQIIDEKTKHFKKEFSQFINFKKESHNKLEELDKRLTKIEDSIEDLKMAIIKKVGDYGENIKNLSNEMRATQDSFSKIINPLTTQAKQAQATQSITETKPTSKPKTQKPKKDDSFEDYIR